MGYYRYWNGQRMAEEDVDVLRRLTHGLRLPEGRTRGPADPGLLSGIRRAFRVKAWEQGGLTEAETVSLLRHFRECGDGG